MRVRGVITISLGTVLIGFEFKPAPVDDLVGEDGCEDDFEDGAGEGFVELSLAKSDGLKMRTEGQMMGVNGRNLRLGWRVWS